MQYDGTVNGYKEYNYICHCFHNKIIIRYRKESMKKIINNLKYI